MADPVTIKIFASLKRWTEKPEYQIQVEGQTTLKWLIEQLGIPEGSVSVAIRNGIQVKLDTEVEPGDVISLLPPVYGG